jgi:hypothetical protein
MKRRPWIARVIDDGDWNKADLIAALIIAALVGFLAFAAGG